MGELSLRGPYTPSFKIVGIAALRFVFNPLGCFLYPARPIVEGRRFDSRRVGLRRTAGEARNFVGVAARLSIAYSHSAPLQSRIFLRPGNWSAWIRNVVPQSYLGSHIVGPCSPVRYSPPPRLGASKASFQLRTKWRCPSAPVGRAEWQGAGCQSSSAPELESTSGLELWFCRSQGIILIQ
jgi:hypothetical protein